MTGFSQAEGTLLHQKVRIEVRSLNHRFLEIKTRLPREFSSLEQLVRKEIQSHLTRGSVDLKLDFLSAQKTSQLENTIHPDVAAHYYKQLQQLQKKLKIKSPILLRDVLSFSDVVSRKGNDREAPEGGDSTWSALQPLISKALQELKAQREKEGKKLQDFYQSQIQKLRRNRQSLEEKRLVYQKSLDEKISVRVHELYERFQLSESQADIRMRIASELSLIMDRSDIAEELHRLEHHLNEFDSTVTQGGSIGKKLEFISQELMRETNTMGSKSQDLPMMTDLLDSKVLIEQIREQVLNTE